MTTDEAFKLADSNLDIVFKIWSGKMKSQYAYAQKLYEEAVHIRDEYFPDNKKILTEDLCPF